MASSGKPFFVPMLLVWGYQISHIPEIVKYRLTLYVSLCEEMNTNFIFSHKEKVLITFNGRTSYVFCTFKNGKTGMIFS